MQVTMQHAERLTLAEMREFLDASSNLSFVGAGRKHIYGLLEGGLRAQKYLELSKKDKGIVRRYLVKISGLSKAQITRLIARWRERGVIEPRASRRHRFPHRYTPADIQLLAETDAAHEGLSAPAVRRILEREFKVGIDDQLDSIDLKHIVVWARLGLELELVAQAGAATTDHAQAQGAVDVFLLKHLADSADRLGSDIDHVLADSVPAFIIGQTR